MDLNIRIRGMMDLKDQVLPGCKSQPAAISWSKHTKPLSDYLFLPVYPLPGLLFTPHQNTRPLTLLPFSLP